MRMGFKKTTRSLYFAALALANCLAQNRSIKLVCLKAYHAVQILGGHRPVVKSFAKAAWNARLNRLYPTVAKILLMLR
jgi:hypothetical protein